MRSLVFLKITASVVVVTFTSLYMQPAIAALQLEHLRQKASQRTASPEDQYAAILADIEHQVRKASANRRNGKDSQAEARSVRELAASLKPIEASIEASLVDMQLRLDKRGFSAQVRQRHQEAIAAYQSARTAFEKLVGELAVAENSGSRGNVDLALSSLAAYFDRHVQSRGHNPLDPAKLPLRLGSRGGSKILSEIAAPHEITNNSNKLALSVPGPEDLAETDDVKITPAIRDKALELGSPRAIYGFVRNNFDFVPTTGSVLGADVAFSRRSGNAFDIASVLIALYRAANIPARYVVGTIELPAARLTNWVGVSSPEAAIELLQQGGIAASAKVAGGVITSVQMSHVWVEAWLNYLPSRGAGNRAATQAMWIPMDAAFKQYSERTGMDLSAVTFDAPGFIASSTRSSTINPQEGWIQNIDAVSARTSILDYQSRLQAYVDGIKPNASMVDVIGGREVVPRESPILAATLANPVVGTPVRYSALPSGLRYVLQVRLYGSEADRALGNSLIAFDVALPRIAGKRITLTYEPASADDAKVISDTINGGLASTLPAYLIQLVPTLRLENDVVGRAPAIGMGQRQIMSVAFAGVVAPDEREYFITAGDVAALAVNAAGVTPDEFNARITGRDLLAGETADYVQEIYYQLATSWWAQKTSLNRIIAARDNVVQYQLPSHALSGTALRVNYLFGLPRSAVYSSRFIDGKADNLAAVARDGRDGATRTFARAAGRLGSALEGGVFDAAFLLPAGTSVSSISAISAANDQGIKLYTIDATNAAAIDGISTSSDDLDDMRAAILANKRVITPQRDLAMGTFFGIGYIIEDPVTGAAAYQISGGRSGGNSGTPAESVFPLPEIPTAGAGGVLIGTALRAAPAGAAVPVVAAATGESALVGVGVAAGSIAGIIGILLLLLLLIYLLNKLVDQLYPPISERVRHYTRAFDKNRRYPDGTPIDPENLPPRDIIQIERFAAFGLLKSGPGEFGPGVYTGDRGATLANAPALGSQALFACPPSAAQADAVMDGYNITAGSGESSQDRISAFIDITFTRQNWPPRDSNSNSKQNTEIRVKGPFLFYLLQGSYFGVQHDGTCR